VELRPEITRALVAEHIMVLGLAGARHQAGEEKQCQRRAASNAKQDAEQSMQWLAG
jgi:lactate dehydrogenase-like 2-hydroxyacid dehydrogenase